MATEILADEIRPVSLSEFWTEHQRNSSDEESVVVEATVTYHDPFWKMIFLQDDEFADYVVSDRKERIVAGTRIRIRATYNKDSSSLSYDQNSLEVLDDPIAMPDAITIGSGNIPGLHKTRHMCHRIQSWARLVSVEGWNTHTVLHLAPLAGNTVPAYLPMELTPDLALKLSRWVGERIRFSAVVGAQESDEGVALGVALFLSDLGQIELPMTPAVNASQQPLTSDEPEILPPVVIRGTVTFVRPDGLYIQNPAGAAFYSFAPTATHFLNKDVEAVVSPGMNSRRALAVRLHSLKETSAINFAKVVPEDLDAIESRLVIAEGKVSAFRFDDNELKLLLKKNDRVFAVSISGTAAELAGLSIYTAERVRLRGICSLRESVHFSAPAGWVEVGVNCSITALSPQELVITRRETIAAGSPWLWILAAVGMIVLLLPWLLVLQRSLARKSREVRFLNSHLKSLYACDPVSTVVTDENGMILSANPSARLIFGQADLPVSEWPLIQTLLQVSFKAQCPSVSDGINGAFSDGRFEFSLTSNSTPRQHINVVVVPIDSAMRSNRMLLWVLNDTTDSVEMREQMFAAQRAQAVGQMAGGLAHDFNNVLQIISGNLQIASTVGPERMGDLQKRIKTAEEATESASQLIKRLLQLSRNATTEVSDVSACELLNNFASLMSGTFSNSNALRVTMPSPDIVIRADMAQLEQALVNVCLNAKDAIAANGRVHVSIERHETEDGSSQRGLAVLKCSDNGCGISEEYRDRIFEPFFTTKATGRGTGLGLVSARSAVECMGGSIEVDSVVHQGTDVRIYLPMATEPYNLTPQKKLPKPQFRSKRQVGRRRILVVDDDDHVRAVTVASLVRSGNDVVDAASGVAAIQILTEENGQFDVLVLDRRMPGMTGDEVFERVSKQWPEIRVIICTGFVCESDPLCHSGCEVLKKPYRISDLQRLVAPHIDTPSVPQTATKTIS